MDHVDEFRGSKNGGNELWGGRKIKKSGDKPEQPPSSSPARCRLVRRRLVVKFHGRLLPAVAP